MTSSSTIAPWTTSIAQRRLSTLEAGHRETTSKDVGRAVCAALRAHHRRIDEFGIVLYAGTNIMSPSVDALHDSALSTRPALGWPGEKVQTAVDDIEELEVIATRQVARSLRGRYAEVRFLTATMANLAVYIAFTRPGDTIAVLSPESGGHASHQGISGTAGVRGLTVEHLPYSPDLFDVDTAALTTFLDATRPAVIVIGGSVTLFPHDVGAVKAAADAVGAVLVYDASHTAGLVAAGQFQDPIAEGADVVTFSTYKTYGGPAGGAAVTDNVEYAERIADAAYPTLLSNYDPARLGPLAMAAVEAVEQAPAWAGPTIEYAGELAAHLNTLGLVVAGRRRGYTTTHQVVVDVQALGGGTAVMRRLERDGLYTGACRLPWQSPGTPPEGLRIGTQEMVRRGASFDLIPELAVLIAESATDTTSSTARASLVSELRARFGPDLWGRAPRSLTSAARTTETRNNESRHR